MINEIEIKKQFTPLSKGDRLCEICVFGLKIPQAKFFIDFVHCKKKWLRAALNTICPWCKNFGATELGDPLNVTPKAEVKSAEIFYRNTPPRGTRRPKMRKKSSKKIVSIQTSYWFREFALNFLLKKSQFLKSLRSFSSFPFSIILVLKFSSNVEK
jgi:hypothetical protein